LEFVMSIIRKLYWGQYSLPVTFWAFFVGGIVAGSVAVMLLANLTILDATKQRQPFLAIYGVGLPIFYSYIVIVAIGVWNSAGAIAESW
jgi:hypothetical protein